MTLPAVNSETLVGIGVPSVRTGTLEISLVFDHRDITKHAGEKGDANEIHFRKRKWGFIVQESLVASKAIDPIKEALRRVTRKNPILDEIERVKFPAPAYSGKPILIKIDFQYLFLEERILITFCGTQKFPQRENVCFQGSASFYTGRIRLKR